MNDFAQFRVRHASRLTIDHQNLFDVAMGETFKQNAFPDRITHEWVCPPQTVTGCATTTATGTRKPPAAGAVTGLPTWPELFSPQQ